MKILLASDGKTLESSIAKRFGHANYYLIYDDVSKKALKALKKLKRRNEKTP